MTDPIADYLTRVRNAVRAGHRLVVIPHSKVKENISKILLESGYILGYKAETDERNHKQLKIALKYDAKTKEPALAGLKRVSSPGLRQYSSSEELPRVMNGLGIAIISTSKGLLTDKQARRENVGGEVMCYIY